MVVEARMGTCERSTEMGFGTMVTELVVSLGVVRESNAPVTITWVRRGGG